MGIKQYLINKATSFLMTRKAIRELEAENTQLMALKNEVSNQNYKNVYDVNMPNVNTPFDLIEFDQIQEFSIIDESIILVTLPYEKLALTIEDDYYLLEFLKRAITLCGVSLIGRESLLLTKTLEFYLVVKLDQPINLVELKEVIYNATWHIKEEPTTFDWYEREKERK